MRRMNSVETTIESRFLLGKSIRDTRRKQQLTQEQLGSIIGLDRSIISRVERGKCNPTFDTIMLISEGLGVTPSELLIEIGLPSRTNEPLRPWL